MTRTAKAQTTNDNPDNEWLDLVAERVAASMVDWLKHTINPRKPINALTKPEIVALAANAIGAYEVELSRRPETQRSYPPTIDLLI